MPMRLLTVLDSGLTLIFQNLSRLPCSFTSFAGKLSSAWRRRAAPR
ncbi:hypothetical protein JD844_005132 [Phrynosoma platyrhinos]|uniref:Uncharacterized protein n=1 Tax=Phrynosoma platyrhinos TaxID=52577 RepID=A0ABQ7TN89_PHRPL|nr:hypothetical protein JD844_005132 [Phrynosoma platyrhinos]